MPQFKLLTIVFSISEVENTFYERALLILLDSEEAAVVRENAAQLLANLAGLSAPLGIERIVPANVPVLKKVILFLNILHNLYNHFLFQSFTLKLFDLLEGNNFFTAEESIIESLFTLKIPDVGKPFESELSNQKLFRIIHYFM